MRRPDLFRSAVLAAGLVLAAGSTADAQGGGSNLLPGATAQQRPDGGALTTCSARNALGTKQCTSTCPAGKSADCEDGDGGSDPVCTCSGG